MFEGVLKFEFKRNVEIEIETNDTNETPKGN